MADANKVTPMNGELYAALIKAVANFPDLGKDKKGNYGFYGSLPATLKAVREPLAAQGLVITQPVVWAPEKVNRHTNEITLGQAYQRTILTHAATGQQIESALPLNVNQDEKRIGASMTYFRRYLVCSLLGIQADDLDLDSEGMVEEDRLDVEEDRLNELRLMSVKMAEKAYGKDHPDLEGLAGVIRKAAAVQSGIARPDETQIAKFAAAMGSVTLGFDENGDPMIAAEPDRATGPDPLLQSICEGELDPADMPITPLDAKKGEQG